MEHPQPPAPTTRTRGLNELTLRVVSSAVLAPLAVGVAYLGGWAFFAFWMLAACGILEEWRKIIADRDAMFLAVGTCAVGAAGLMAMEGYGSGAAIFIAFGMAVEVGLASTRLFRIWSPAGVLYAGSLLVSCVLLRNDASYGFAAIILLFAIVWATDILGYFVGRFVGGPKLWTRISPKKTWSGALGGGLGAMAAGLAVAHYAHVANSLAVVGLALLLSIASQAGDLLESGIKRRFGVKDASHLIPGHGGIMDRLDGFLVAAVVAAMIGIARGGIEAPARGLLVW